MATRSCHHQEAGGTKEGESIIESRSWSHPVEVGPMVMEAIFGTGEGRLLAGAGATEVLLPEAEILAWFPG